MNAQPAPPRAVEGIELGLAVGGSRLRDAVAIEIPPDKRNSRGWPTMFVAGRIVGGDLYGDQIGVWVLGEDESAPAAPCHGINAVAREWSTWGVDVKPD